MTKLDTDNLGDPATLNGMKRTVDAATEYGWEVDDRSSQSSYEAHFVFTRDEVRIVVDYTRSGRVRDATRFKQGGVSGWIASRDNGKAETVINWLTEGGKPDPELYGMSVGDYAHLVGRIKSSIQVSPSRDANTLAELIADVLSREYTLTPKD